ncbi:MAG: YraN family protein [Gammaproteobacteria bacterium]|nr:YraN family protein [Gammaproteobacteria bacterium]
MSRPIGFAQEDRALAYLQKQGLHLIIRNFSCKLGEIDLIMRDSLNKLIFVEVRYRGTQHYGGSAASVSRGKQIRLVRTANWYLRAHYPCHPPLCRFDVVAINGDNESDFNWIKNAFYS